MILKRNNTSLRTASGVGSDLWLECAKRKLAKKPVIHSALQQLQVNPGDFDCRQLVVEAIRKYDVEDALNSDSFTRTNSMIEDNLSGEISLGYVKHTNAEWRIPSSSLTQHLLICGKTGGGKSVIIKSIIIQVQDVALFIADRKSDFDRIAVNRGIPYFLLNDFLDNLLAPPPGVKPYLWFNILSELFITSFGLRAAAQSQLVDVLLESGVQDGLDNQYPTMAVLKKRLKKRLFANRGSSRDITSRLHDRVDWLATMLGDSASAESHLNWDKLMSTGCTVNLAGIPNLVQSLWIAVYFAKVLLYRICNNLRSDKLEVLFVFDEASPIFPKSVGKNTSILLDYFQQCRAFGIGVIFASQSMNLSDSILANTATKIAVGGLGLGSDYESFGSCVGLSGKQREYMRKIGKPGSAVVKDNRCAEAFTAKVTFKGEEAHLSPQELEALSKESRKGFIDESSPVTRQSAMNTHGSPNAELLSSCVSHKTLEESSAPRLNSVAMDNALRIITAQADFRMPFLFRHEAASLAGIRGAATLLKAEKEALNAGLILRHELPRGRANICLWEIRDFGYESINRQQPKWKSKGAYLHKLAAHRIAASERLQGCKATIEYYTSNGKLIDVCSQRGNVVKYIEVCSSYPLEKELSNLRKDTAEDSDVAEIVFAVTERKMKRPLLDAIETFTKTNPAICPIRVVLAGDLIDTLEITK